MALFLGVSQVKIISDNSTYTMNIPELSPSISGILLMSYDNYTLKDSNGVYLTVKEEN